MNDPVVLGIGIVASVVAAALGVTSYFARARARVREQALLLPIQATIETTKETVQLESLEDSTAICPETFDTDSPSRPHGGHKRLKSYRVVKKADIELSKAKTLALDTERRTTHDDSPIVCECADPQISDDATEVIYECSDVSSTDMRARNMRTSRMKVETWLKKMANEPLITAEGSNMEATLELSLRDSPKTPVTSENSSRSDNSSVYTEATTITPLTGLKIVKNVSRKNSTLQVDTEVTKPSHASVTNKTARPVFDIQIEKTKHSAQETTTKKPSPTPELTVNKIGRKIIIQRNNNLPKPISRCASIKSKKSNTDKEKQKCYGTSNVKQTTGKVDQPIVKSLVRKSNVVKAVPKKVKEPITPAIARLLAKNYRLGGRQTKVSDSEYTKSVQPPASDESKAFVSQTLKVKSSTSSLESQGSVTSTKQCRREVQLKTKVASNCLNPWNSTSGSEITNKISEIGNNASYNENKEYEDDYKIQEKSRKDLELMVGDVSFHSKSQDKSICINYNDILDLDVDFIENQYLLEAASSYHSSVSMLEDDCDDASATAEQHYRLDTEPDYTWHSQGYVGKKTKRREELPDSHGTLRSKSRDTSKLDLGASPSESTENFRCVPISDHAFPQCDGAFPLTGYPLAADSIDSYNLDSDGSLLGDDSELYSKVFCVQSEPGVSSESKCGRRALRGESESGMEMRDEKDSSSEVYEQGALVLEDGRDSKLAGTGCSEGQVEQIVTDGFITLEKAIEAEEDD